MLEMHLIFSWMINESKNRGAGSNGRKCSLWSMPNFVTHTHSQGKKFKQKSFFFG